MNDVPSYLTGFLAAVILLAFPGSAPGQDIYAEQVNGYLDEMENRELSAAHTLEGQSTSWMFNGAEAATIVRLPAGSYVVIGACDEDCSDIDLVASRMDTQEMLDDDQEMDAFPTVAFSLDQETDVIIGMAMPDCATPRCFTGYRWYVDDGSGEGEPPPTGAGAGGWEEQVMIQLGSIPVPDGMSKVDERTGLIEAGQNHRFSISLDRGTYGGIAVCDNDCSNLDLAVYDAGGSLLSSDELDDDVPLVDFEVGEGGATYYVEVRMVSCATGTCGYGFQLYQEGPE